jgi:hypothetical protein
MASDLMSLRSMTEDPTQPQGLPPFIIFVISMFFSPQYESAFASLRCLPHVLRRCQRLETAISSSSAMKALALLLTTLTTIHAQVKLLSPAWLPPSAETGAQSSSTIRPNQHWSTLVGELLYFYDAQRSGKLINNRVGWRNDSATKDGDVRVDLTGGFYDAGSKCVTWNCTNDCS